MIDSIIFDLDGTLLNTLDDLHDSVNHVLSLHGFPQRSLDEIRSFVGNGIPTLIRRSVPAGTEEYIAAECTAQMLSWYGEHSKIKTDAYDGIKDILKFLKDKNIKTAVVTNKAEESAKLLCREIFGDVFCAVIGDDGKTPLKPAPDNVFRAMDIIKADRETTLYIGDSEVDMMTAENSGLKSVGVLWGFRDEETLRKNGANFIISFPDDIKCLIN